jgi:hypothetical protein
MFRSVIDPGESGPKPQLQSCGRLAAAAAAVLTRTGHAAAARSAMPPEFGEGQKSRYARSANRRSRRCGRAERCCVRSDVTYSVTVRYVLPGCCSYGFLMD